MQDSDGSPARTPRSFQDTEASIDINATSPILASSKTESGFSLPFRRNNNASLSALFASTSKRPGQNRSASSNNGTPQAQEIAESPFTAQAAGNDNGSRTEYRTLISRAFAPSVGILASTDLEELLAQKGIPGGLLELIRPFGESIPGKVTVRDSTGSSKTWNDYGIRFKRLRDGLESPRAPSKTDAEAQSPNIDGVLDHYFPDSSARLRTGGDIDHIEEVVDQHLIHSEVEEEQDAQDEASSDNIFQTSPFHALYTRRLLSGLPLVPHETFSHPVACVIAVSSRHQDPIDESRQMHRFSGDGDQALPPWASSEYLRYFVLVHDEEHDDLQRSISIFEQMKRHFGLHCHLLRLRSTQCLPSDDGCERLPLPEFMSASEELRGIRAHGRWHCHYSVVSSTDTRPDDREQLEDSNPCLFESDTAAIRNFVRELVTQSVVPVMERMCATWNDQIVSRRRGLSGRIFSLSKKWTPFGSRNGSTTTPTPGSNYDASLGWYRADAPEALMRKLADYSFMLRDYKNAQSVYDLLRTDFANDKAWKYSAGANEMSAISLLMHVDPTPSRGRNDTVDQMLEAATYSYTTRCAAPFYALRTLTVAVELLKQRAGCAPADAARWATRLLELELVGATGHALIVERLAACYGSQIGAGSQCWGAKRRKAAFWSVLACQAWLRLERHAQAAKCLERALLCYRVKRGEASPLAFESMRDWIAVLESAVRSQAGGGSPEAPGAASSSGAAGAAEAAMRGDGSAQHEMRKPRKSFSSSTGVETTLRASQEVQGEPLYFDPDDPLGSRDLE